MMASKARLFGGDSALSAILATNDPCEHKRLGRQIRHFDYDSWQHERENIAIRGNLAKCSQNKDLRLTLLHTGQRRLTEASPHSSLWGIDLRAATAPFLPVRGVALTYSVRHHNMYEKLSIARPHPTFLTPHRRTSRAR